MKKKLLSQGEWLELKENEKLINYFNLFGLIINNYLLLIYLL